MSAGLQRMSSARTLQFPEGVEGTFIDHRLHVQMRKHQTVGGVHCRQQDKDFACAVSIHDLQAALS